MDYFKNRKWISCSFLVLFYFLSMAFQGICAQSVKQPNIILILLDDVSPDIYSCYGLPGSANTPNVDGLAAKGVMFETCYAASMCAPSRVEIMTGKYGSSTGVLHNDMWMGNSYVNVYNDHQSFGRLLKNAGYATAIAGKWHAGESQPYEDSVGFDEYCLWEMEGAIHKLPNSPKFTGLMEDEQTTSRYWHPAIVQNNKLIKTEQTDFGPDIFASFIMDFMERKAKEEKPFLAYWPSVAPHGTRTGYPTNPHRGKHGDLGNRKNVQENHARFLSLNEYMDFLVGKIVDKIMDLGIKDNTIIIFTSDNGTAGTAKTRGVERGCHVINIISGAGIKPRGATGELTDFTDIAPTLLSFAGGKLPQGKTFDGISLKPFLTGNSEHTKDWIYGFIATSQIVRTKDYLLEAVNPFLEYPMGRLYYTGNNRFGRGYEFVNGKVSFEPTRKKFDDFLKDFLPVTKENPFWKTTKGIKFRHEYTSPEYIKRHLHNHKDYKFYDEGMD